MACSACGAPLHRVGVCPRLVAQRRKEGDAEAALRTRLREAEARVARLEELLSLATHESHHADGCPVRYREPCACWKSLVRTELEEE